MTSKKKIIIIAVIIIAVVAVGVGIYLLQSFFASFAEVDGTINNLVNRLNSRDVAGTWALTSQDFREYVEYGDIEEMIDILDEMEWHASIQSIDSREIETINGITSATVTLTARITDAFDGTYNETWTVYLTKIDNEWKIDSWSMED